MYIQKRLSRLSTIRKVTLSALALILLIMTPFVFFDEQTESGTATYQLVWDWGDAVPDADGSGWTVTNNLGYDIHVERAYVVSLSAQLLECEHRHGLFAPIIDLFAPAIVFAGHGGDDDLSKVDLPLVEDLSQPETQLFGEVVLVEPDYCKAHYLIARASSNTRNLPGDVELYGLSVYLQGTYSYRNNEETLYTIKTHHANGVIQELHLPDDPTVIRAKTDPTLPIEITIRRDLSALFTDVDFENMSPDEAGKTALWSLMASTDVMLSGGKTNQS